MERDGRGGCGGDGRGGGKGYGMKGRRGRENTPCRWQDSISTFFVDWLTSTMVNKYGECVCMYIACMCVCVCACVRVCVATQLYSVPYISSPECRQGGDGRSG